MSKDKLVILGIHFAHDSNATLIVDGKIKCAIAEERLNRQKMYTGFPYQSIQWVLDEEGIKPQDVDYVVACGEEEPIGDYISIISLLYNRKMKIGFSVKLISYFISLIDNILSMHLRKKITSYLVCKILSNLVFDKDRVIFVDHHLAHVATAYFCSGWQDKENIIVFSIDGKGDGLSHRSCIIEDGKIKVISKSKDYDSIGLFYMAATQYLGFIPLRHEGKVTGLAAYGDHKIIKDIPSPVEANDNSFQNNLISSNEKRSTHWIFLKLLFTNLSLFKQLLLYSSSVKAHYVKYQLLKFYEDRFKNYRREEVATYAQEKLEKEVVRLVKKQAQGLKKSKICLAGGVCANVKLNQRILNIPGIENVYIQPAMGDGGLSMGAALYIYSQKMNESGLEFHPFFLENVYLGTGYSQRQIEEELKLYKLKYEYVKEIEPLIAKLISEGKIVGRFNGCMEWGPRALGNRSILADPRDANINDTLNKRLRRSEFMPFAPSMLEEYAKDYLIGYRSDHIAARFMTITYDVYPDKIKEIPAVVHIDGTARPQVVGMKDNPSYYKIIAEFMKITSLPVIINTSFNIHEEPIVHTPEDAIRSFKENAVDVLAIGNFIVH